MKAPAARSEAGSRGGGDFLAQLGEGGRGQDGAAAPPPAPGGGLLAPPPQAPPAAVRGASAMRSQFFQGASPGPLLTGCSTIQEQMTGSHAHARCVVSSTHACAAGVLWGSHFYSGMQVAQNCVSVHVLPC